MKRLILALVLFAALSSTALAVDTVTFDAAAVGTSCSPCTSITYALTVGANSNRIVVAGGKTPADDLTGITYAGNALTLIDEQSSTGLLAAHCQAYYILAPTTGSNNIVFTASSSAAYLASQAASYYNVNQVTPPIKDKGVTDSNVERIQSLTSVVDNSWGVAFFNNQSGACSAGAGTNLRADSGAYASCMGDSGAITPAGADNVRMTAGSGNWCSVGFIIEPSNQPPAASFCIRPGIC